METLTIQYILCSIEIGKAFQIHRLRIEHDNSGFGPAWHLDKVIIRSADSTPYYFHCTSWLADDIGDKQTVRDIASSDDPTGASASKLIWGYS